MSLLLLLIGCASCGQTRFENDQARGGNKVSFEESTPSGSPCFRTIDGCDYGLAMTSGTVDILDMNARHDPCDPFAQMEMDMSWDLEFSSQAAAIQLAWA